MIMTIHVRIVGVAMPLKRNYRSIVYITRSEVAALNSINI